MAYICIQLVESYSGYLKSEVFELISNRIDEYNFHLTNRELDYALFGGKHA